MKIVLLCLFYVVMAFRSYHPHYLHSYSYAQPSTLHMYYGRVVSNNPVFLIRSGQDGDETRVFIVNGRADRMSTLKPMPAKSERQFNSMLVFAIEDSTEGNETARLQVGKGIKHHIVAMVNKTSSKAYSIHVTKNNELVETSQYENIGVSMKIVNVSQDPRNNWRLSSYIRWNDFRKAQEPYKIKETRSRLLKQINFPVTRKLFNKSHLDAPIVKRYTALLFQISIPDNQLGNIKINIDQQKVKNTKGDIPSGAIFDLIDVEYKPLKMILSSPTCAEDAVDKLFRGLSFEYGRIHIVNGSMPVKNQPRALLSFSPSRKRFPWGFLWDDGFHNAVAARYQPLLSVRVIQSWLDTMIDGWIPREQDRGTERQYLCNCPMFLDKDIRDGNPPSLIIPLFYLLQNGHLTQQFKKSYWGKLKQWHAWYMRTQMTKDDYLFKWFDHIKSDGSFNSGMDDFPRPLYTKYHIDAQSWMYALTQFIVKASRQFEPEKTAEYQQKMEKIKANLIIFQFDGIYVDIVQRPSSQFEGSPHIGYGSILPLAFGMLEQNSHQFNKTLNLLTDPTMLNTSHGLSSIQTSSPLYLATKDAYWRGPVWINMNYLALRGLKLYYNQPLTYNLLRQQLINTVCGQWSKRGYFFQNYIQGTGSFSYPFNGWTSLIANIINEHY